MGVENNKTETQGQAERIDALRESIRRSFPAESYKGRVTPNDDGLDDPDLDEDRDLYEALNGRKWTEVPTRLLQAESSGYELLTDEAFTAFLPAWLMRSLEDMDAENEVRNFVVYSFSATMRRFSVLNPEQQLTVRSILEQFTERGTCTYVRNLAAEAIALIDRRRY